MNAIKKLKVPQINEDNGMSCDYLNTICQVHQALHLYYEKGLDKFDKVPRLKRYSETYSPDKFEDVVNDRNRKAIGRLDEIVDKINVLLDSGSRRLEDYVPLIQETERIILGSVKRTAGMEMWGKENEKPI